MQIDRALDPKQPAQVAACPLCPSARPLCSSPPIVKGLPPACPELTRLEVLDNAWFLLDLTLLPSCACMVELRLINCRVASL